MVLDWLMRSFGFFYSNLPFLFLFHSAYETFYFFFPLSLLLFQLLSNPYCAWVSSLISSTSYNSSSSFIIHDIAQSGEEILFGLEVIENQSLLSAILPLPFLPPSKGKLIKFNQARTRKSGKETWWGFFSPPCHKAAATHLLSSNLEKKFHLLNT